MFFANIHAKFLNTSLHLYFFNKFFFVNCAKLLVTFRIGNVSVTPLFGNISCRVTRSNTRWFPPSVPFTRHAAQGCHSTSFLRFTELDSAAGFFSIFLLLVWGCVSHAMIMCVRWTHAFKWSWALTSIILMIGLMGNTL